MRPAVFNATLEEVLNLVGTFVFAMSGALLAVRKRYDIVGMTVLAEITAIGGGVVRDLVLSALTGVGGGIMRDVLANEQPAVLRAYSELYAVPAVLGSASVVVVQHLSLYGSLAAGLAALFVFVLRIAVLRYGWRAPRPASHRDT